MQTEKWYQQQKWVDNTSEVLHRSSIKHKLNPICEVVFIPYIGPTFKVIK